MNKGLVQMGQPMARSHSSAGQRVYAAVDDLVIVLGTQKETPR